MSKFPLLESWTNDRVLQDLDPDVMREIQSILGVTVSGYCCQATLTRFAEFKQANYLEFPDRLGPTTALSLIEFTYKHEISEQLQNRPAKVEPNAGSLTGKSVILPAVGKVFQHQYIVTGIPLTWGEMTKGLDSRRIPESKEIVENIIELAKVFGIAREKYGKPVAVSSGHRPASLGIGAKRSQHILGKALDSFPLLIGDIRTWYNIVRATPGVMGLGDATNRGRESFVHMDTRNERAQVRFGY
jgi:hypothetical protein